jgi:hypothetical protein
MKLFIIGVIHGLPLIISIFAWYSGLATGLANDSFKDPNNKIVNSNKALRFGSITIILLTLYVTLLAWKTSL